MRDAIRGPSEAIRGHQRPSEGDQRAIRGHQRAIRGRSEAIRGPSEGDQRAISSKESTLIGGRGSSEALGGAIKRHSVTWAPSRARTTVPC